MHFATHQVIELNDGWLEEKKVIEKACRQLSSASTLLCHRAPQTEVNIIGYAAASGGGGRSQKPFVSDETGSGST